MIIFHVLGGLGNQMFQYAAGRSLSYKHGVQLFLDVSDFGDYDLHQGYEIARIFNCSAKTIRSCQLRDFMGWRSLKFARRLLRLPYASMLRGEKFIVEPHFHYWTEFLSLSYDLYLCGYWQSEKYFEAISDVIHSDFEFILPLMSKNEDIASQMSNSHSVSVHVRRGDYVTNITTNMVHGVCSREYYLAAIEYISQRVDNPVFYFFSDDMSWVKQNLLVNHQCKFIEHNSGAQSFNDMRLMSLCQHHIIANSSFSWWGAWLGKNREKIVVAPERWFLLPNINTEDVCPASWVRL